MASLLERERELAAAKDLLVRGGGLLIVEGAAGIGKTSLLDEACRYAAGLGHGILRARGSELEGEFAFGVVLQLFERRLACADAAQRAALLEGPARAVRPLLIGDQPGEAAASDLSFAVLHGLYWLTANLADGRPLMIAVDDAQWADEPSLRWLVHLAPRLSGLAVTLVVALRPGETASRVASLAALRSEASTVLQPELLSEAAVGVLVRAALGPGATDELCATVWEGSGGNPLFVAELLRAASVREDGSLALSDPALLLASGGEGIARRVLAQVRGLGPGAPALARALAVLGDGCQLRHASAVAGLEITEARSLAAGLVRVGVLAADDPPFFLHPIVRVSVDGSLARDERDAAHHNAARVLYAEGAPAGQVAAHLMSLRPAGDSWVLARLREAADAAMRGGAAPAAARLLDRAL
ncbi:MAG: AAA family ATPase, partial [Nocardiopsaceae bacterium]|nr:AAA family ATPase [Nocardiopsaceae bacterium]